MKIKFISYSKIIITIFCLVMVIKSPSQDLLTHFTSESFEQNRFAHRGGYANGPENTLHTILTNIQNGITAIEIDVQLTKDNQLVLFHDDQINRVLNTNRDLNIADMNLADLKKIPLRDSTQGVQYICSFQELVETLVVLIPKDSINDFLLEVDFKPHGKQAKDGVDALVKILNSQLAVFGDQLYNYFFISTFYPDVLKQVIKTDKKIVTAFAMHNSPDRGKLKAKMAVLFAPVFVRKYNASIIEPNTCMVNARFVSKWHKKGVLINTYTANRACEKQYIESLPIAYTTNCPKDFCEPDASDQVSKAKGWCKKCSVSD